MEDNRIQNQIAIYMTNKKLCEFTDKLKPTPIEYYAHMHAQGEEQADGIRAYSCIGVVLQDYSNGTGDKTVRVTANLSPGFFPFVLSRINRGDIFYVNPSETVGSEQRSGRPAIIVSNPLCNEHSPVVEVVYLTCQYKKPMPTHVRIESAGKRSTALCEQISSVDVSRLGDFKGHLTDREMAQVDVALMASLDLHPIPRQAKVRPVVPDVDDAALALIALRFLEGFLQKRCGVTVQDRLSIDLLGQKND